MKAIATTDFGAPATLVEVRPEMLVHPDRRCSGGVRPRGRQLDLEEQHQAGCPDLDPLHSRIAVPRFH